MTTHAKFRARLSLRATLPRLAAHRDDAASTWRLSKRCISRRPRKWTRAQITPVCAAAFSRVWASVGARTAAMRALSESGVGDAPCAERPGDPQV
jgi:hypothetical protein